MLNAAPDGRGGLRRGAAGIPSGASAAPESLEGRCGARAYGRL